MLLDVGVIVVVVAAYFFSLLFHPAFGYYAWLCLFFFVAMYTSTARTTATTALFDVRLRSMLTVTIWLFA